MRLYAPFIALLLFFGSSIAHAHDRPPGQDSDMEETTGLLPAGPSNKSDLDIAPEMTAINQLAMSRGVILSREQIMYIGDILLAYYDGEATRRDANHPNVIWVATSSSFQRREMIQAIQFVIEYLDPARSVEHMRLQHYMMLEPELFNQKIREQGKRFAIMDDIVELHLADDDQTQIRAAEYAIEIMANSPKNMTYFMIDKNGALFKGLDTHFRSLVTPVTPDRYMRTVCEGQLYKIQ